jgi:hypothetical protein
MAHITYDNIPVTTLALPATADLAAEVSKHILQTLQFSSLLDAGCGSDDPTLAQYVIHQRHAEYYGFDKGCWWEREGQMATAVGRLAWLLPEITDVGKHLFVSNLLKPAPQIPQCDIVHIRAVLIHNPLEDWPTILQSAISLARQAIVCVEFDRRIMQRGELHPLMRRFLELDQRMTNVVGCYRDDAGLQLAKLAQIYPKTEMHRFAKPCGDNRSYLLAMCDKGYHVAFWQGEDDLARAFENLSEAIQLTPFECNEPEVCAAIIRA